MSERRALRGFTLVKMLVVISIISILIGLLLGALSAARTRAKVAQTEATIKLLKGALERYEMDFQDYPPSKLTKEDQKKPPEKKAEPDKDKDKAPQ
jgi:type II secretion system protein G